MNIKYMHCKNINNQEENELLITTIIGKSQPFDSHKKKGFRPQSNPRKRLSEWVLLGCIKLKKN